MIHRSLHPMTTPTASATCLFLGPSYHFSPSFSFQDCNQKLSYSLLPMNPYVLPQAISLSIQIDGQVQSGAAHWKDFPSLMVFRAAAKCICGATAVHFQLVPIHQVNTSTKCGFFLSHQLGLKDPHTHHGRTGGSQVVVVDDVGIQAAYWCPLVLPCLIPDAPLLSYTSLNTQWLCMNSVHPEQCWFDVSWSGAPSVPVAS